MEDEKMTEAEKRRFLAFIWLRAWRTVVKLPWVFDTDTATGCADALLADFSGRFPEYLPEEVPDV